MALSSSHRVLSLHLLRPQAADPKSRRLVAHSFSLVAYHHRMTRLLRNAATCAFELVYHRHRFPATGCACPCDPDVMVRRAPFLAVFVVNALQRSRGDVLISCPYGVLLYRRRGDGATSGVCAGAHGACPTYSQYLIRHIAIRLGAYARTLLRWCLSRLRLRLRSRLFLSSFLLLSASSFSKSSRPIVVGRH